MTSFRMFPRKVLTMVQMIFLLKISKTCSEYIYHSSNFSLFLEVIINLLQPHQLFVTISRGSYDNIQTPGSLIKYLIFFFLLKL